MIKYKCIKPFSIPEIGCNGFNTGELIEVKTGTTYERYNADYIGGEVHLENENNWIEISYNDLKEYFEELKGGVE